MKKLLKMRSNCYKLTVLCVEWARVYIYIYIYTHTHTHKESTYMGTNFQRLRLRSNALEHLMGHPTNT